MKFEYKYFKKGADIGRPDVIVSLKRPDIHILDNWTDKEKEALRESVIEDLTPQINEFINALTRYISAPEKSRCCGRCNGIDDICVADMICEIHKTEGCRICWPDPE